MSRTYGKAQDLIDYTRASSGTALRRVKYTEKVVNGTFDTDTTGWSVSSNLTASSVSGEAVISCSADFGYFSQNLGLEVGKIYKVYLDVSAVSGTVLVRNGTTAESPADNYKTINSTGSVELTIVPANTGSWFILVFGSGESITIDNISVKEVTFDTSDGDLILFNHPANIPRIEYDANGNLLGLLVEESRTNLIPYSDDFSTSEWTKYYSIAVSPSAVVSPDGQQNAYELTGIESSDGDIGLTDNLVTSPSTTYTASIWVKAANTSDVGKYVKLRSKRNNGTFVAEDQEIQLTSEWVRHSVTITLLADNTGASLTITKATAYPLASRADSCLIYRAQYEQGSFATSAIPTSGSTATRSADVASLSTSAFGYNDEAGTVVFEGTASQVGDPASSQVFVEIGTSNRSDIYLLSRLAGTSESRLLVNDGVTQADLRSADFVGGVSGKMAGSWKVNDFAISTDGGAVQTDTSGNLPENVTIMGIGTLANLTGNYLNGHIKSIKYYPRRLTNAQLQELTS